MSSQVPALCVSPAAFLLRCGRLALAHPGSGQIESAAPGHNCPAVRLHIAVCDFHDDEEPLVPLAADEYRVDTDRVRGFIADVRQRIAQAESPPEACKLISPLFAELLADGDWLPPSFREPAVDSGMGGGIGQWLVFRSADRSLSLFSLVVPPGAMTPVHDHLAWGLVGVYAGSQDEEFYRPAGGHLSLLRQRPLAPGDFYTLLPPLEDIHRVRTTSSETSVSIHLLANDTGCVWRHTYDERTGESSPFRSGYVNADCGSEG